MEPRLTDTLPPMGRTTAGRCGSLSPRHLRIQVQPALWRNGSHEKVTPRAFVAGRFHCIQRLSWIAGPRRKLGPLRRSLLTRVSRWLPETTSPRTRRTIEPRPKRCVQYLQRIGTMGKEPSGRPCRGGYSGAQRGALSANQVGERTPLVAALATVITCDCRLGNQFGAPICRSRFGGPLPSVELKALFTVNNNGGCSCRCARRRQGSTGPMASTWPGVCLRSCRRRVHTREHSWRLQREERGHRGRATSWILTDFALAGALADEDSCVAAGRREKIRGSHCGTALPHYRTECFNKWNAIAHLMEGDAR